MYCRALGVVPTVPLFRVFYKLCKQGDWFSFQSRVGKGLKPCIKGAPTSLKKWKDKFFLIDRRAAPIAMAWRHHDSSVADVLPGPSEYNAADVATLLQVPIQLHKPYNSLLYVAGLSPTWKGLGHVPVMKGPGGKVLTMAEFLRLPDLGACKIVAGTLLPPNFPVDTHLSTPATRLEDVPLKTPAMENAEIACRKVIVARERKKQRAEEHLASKAVGKLFQINARLDILRDQTNEHLDAGHDQSFARDDSDPGPRGDDRGEQGKNDGRDDGQHVGPNVKGGDENDNQNVSPHPSAHRTGGEKTVSTGESSASPFGELPFAPVWGITDSDRMVKFRHCRDMMPNIFTPADLASFEGMDDHEAVRQSWKLLCQSSQQQANMLLRFEKLYDESDGLQESRDRARAKYDSCKKQLVDLQVAYDAKASSYGQLSHDYEDALRREEAGKIKIVELEKEKKRSDELVVSQAERIRSLEIALKESETGIEQLRSDKERFAVAAGQSEAIRKRLITEFFPTFVQRLLQSKEYKESVGEVFSLAVDVDALLNASVNPASFEFFMGEYLKLFETHYPYVDKLARAYLLDPSELQNVMPDGAGPTPGGGPRSSPTAHSSARPFSELPFAPVWGITDSDRIVKFHHCRDMISNIFTPADLASFEGMDDREAVRRSWKLLCQSSQQQANMLLRFEKLYDESDELQESRDRARAKYDSCKKQLVDLRAAYDAKVSSYGQLSHDYEDALRREEAGKIKIVELEKEKEKSDELVVSQAERIRSLETALKESETGIEQLRSDRERFVMAAGQSEAIHVHTTCAHVNFPYDVIGLERAYTSKHRHQ
ncbi:hypothetical protein Tco_1061235, partial [Tanacetum coccineum]